MAFGSRLSSERRGTGPTGVDRMEGNCWTIRLCFSGHLKLYKSNEWFASKKPFFYEESGKSARFHG
jgi:hypothetical protein